MLGDTAEDMVGQAGLRMKREGLILEYIRSDRHGKLDKEGIDSLIILKNGLILPLQIKKSTKDQNNKLRRRHFKKHPNIRFLLFVEINESDSNRSYEQISAAILTMAKEAMRRAP